MTELNMDEKVTVRSIAAWDVGFPNLTRSGDTTIAPHGKTRMRREEIDAQVSNSNRLFTGIDGNGSHATIIIEDEPMRMYLEFDTDENKQTVLTDEKIKAWFELKTLKAFEKNVRENVVTMAEKSYLLDAIKKMKFDSYEKISFCQEYCKFKLF